MRLFYLGYFEDNKEIINHTKVTGGHHWKII